MSVRESKIRVQIDESVTEAESTTLAQVFEEYGIRPDIETSYDSSEAQNAASAQSKRSSFRSDATGAFRYKRAWTILLVAPVNGLAQELGASTFKELVGRLWTTRTTQTGAKGNDGLVMLVDEETGVRVALERDLPDDAYDVLTDLDMRAFRSDPLQYFRDRGRHGRWRSPDNVSGTG